MSDVRLIVTIDEESAEFTFEQGWVPPDRVIPAIRAKLASVVNDAEAWIAAREDALRADLD